MSHLVHLAAPTDHRTACGKWALADDGERLLETDLRRDQVTCKSCLRTCQAGRIRVDRCAIPNKPTPDEQRRKRLAAEYVRLIGYDPFEFDPAITCDEVERTLAEWKIEAQRSRTDGRFGQTLEAERENSSRLRAALIILRGTIEQRNGDSHLHAIIGPSFAELTVGQIVDGALALDKAMVRP